MIDEEAEPRARAGAGKVGQRESHAREELLIRRCIEGDPEAFRPLVERYSPALHSFVVRYVGATDDARDIVQDAFLRAFRSLPDYNPRYRFSTWLYRIALNLCRDHMKRARLHQNDQTFQLEDARHKVVDPIEERLDDRMRCEAALEILRTMPSKYREPLFLKDVQLMDYNQMARVTGMSVGLLKIRVMRARRKLADVMRRRGLALEHDRTGTEEEIES